MPDLPEVTQEFGANVGPWVAAMQTAIEWADKFRDAVARDIAAIEILQETMGGEARAAAAAAEATNAAAAAAAHNAEATAAEAEAANAAADAAQKLAGQAGDQAGAAAAAAAATGTYASRLNDMRNSALEAEAAVSRLKYNIAAAAAASETAAVAVRPAMDEWRDSITAAMEAAELAEFQIDAMDRAIDKSAGDAVIAAGALRNLAAAEAEVAAASHMEADASRLEAEMAADAAGWLKDLNQTRLSGIDTSIALAKADRLLAEADKALEPVTRNLSAGYSDTARAAKGLFGISTLMWHGIATTVIETAAVAIPAAIATGAAAFVLYQGAIEQVGTRLQSMYTATEATASMIGKTTGDVLGLGHAFQTAQNAANPIAYQLLGEYLMAARSHMVNLAQSGLQVDQALGRVGASINVDLLQQGGALSGLLANMTNDAIQLGQVFGNLGHAVLNVVSDMPGLANVLLSVVDGLSRLIEVSTNLGAFSHYLILGAFAFHEFNAIGSLAVAGLNRLGLATQAVEGRFFSFTRAAGIVKNFMGLIPALAAQIARLPFVSDAAAAGITRMSESMTAAIKGMSAWEALGVGLAVAAIGGLVFEMFRAKGAAAEMGDSLQQAVAKAKNVQEFGIIAQNIVTLTRAQDQAAVSARNLGREMGSQGVAGAYKGLAVAQGQAEQNITGLSSAMKQQYADERSLFAGAVTLSNAFGTNLTQSMALADLAGVNLGTTQVKLGKDINQAGIQVESLVNGYRQMSQTGGVLNNDLNAVAVSAGLQQTKVQQLNQAWDQFMANATGLTSSFAAFVTDIGEINNAITTAGTRFRIFSGQVVSSTQAAAMSLRGFGTVGAQVWQNYDAALQQAQQYTDQLRIAAAYGAVTNKQYTQSIAYVVQQLLPYAKYSKTATEELSALAQEAGGPATSSYKTLKDWVEQNTTSTSNFNKIMQQEVGQLSNVSAAAQQFASTLRNDLIQQMVSAGLHFSNVNGLINTYAQMVANGTAATARGQGVRTQLIRDLQGVGMSAGQAAAMVQMLIGEVAGLHDKTFTITEQVRQVTISSGGTGSGNPLGGGLQSGAAYAPGGWTLVGESGPEMVRFAGGEQVVPNWSLSDALGRVRGGADNSNVGPMVIHTHVSIDGREILTATQQQAYAFNRRNGTSVTGSLAPPA